MLVLICIVAIGASVVLAVCLLSRGAAYNLAEKWPAIDDDEFVRRCPTGTRRETALTVRRIISEHIGIPYEHIYPEQSFAKDLDV